MLRVSSRVDRQTCHSIYTAFSYSDVRKTGKPICAFINLFIYYASMTLTAHKNTTNNLKPYTATKPTKRTRT